MTNFQTELARLIRERLLVSKVEYNSADVSDISWDIAGHVCEFFQVPDIVRESLSPKNVMIQYIITRAILLH